MRRKLRTWPGSWTAIQHAMNLRLRDEAAFFAEYQNEPLLATVQMEGELTADQIATKLNKVARGIVPEDCKRLTMFIDVQATAFQWRVWQALKAIPYGDTRSYGQIAQALGDRNAARAVARACATNPVALIIPCHRVVREGGEMGGYRWGQDRKQALLAQEALER